MPRFVPHTVAELIYWSYANLAMAHDGINRGLYTYDKQSFIIRMRLYKGLISGKMQIGSLFKDERWKIDNGARCVYCGATENLSVDHIFARMAPVVFIAVLQRIFLLTTFSLELKVVLTLLRIWFAVVSHAIVPRARRI